MRKFKYTLDADGFVIGCGYMDVFANELKGDEPFSGFEIVDYRKNLETNEWIFDPIIMIPQEITKIQAVKRLLDVDKYNELLMALDADLTGESRILFDAAHKIYRESNMVAQIGVALGFSSYDIDELFIEASKILV